MKKIFIIATFAFGLLTIVSCKKEFLEVNPRGTQLESNYYKNAAEVFSGLVAAYDPMGWEAVNMWANFACLNAASDDCYGGGGSSSDVPYIQVMNNYAFDPANGPQQDFWDRNYTGIARVNSFLLTLENDIPDLSDAVIKRYSAEAKFLRAYYYFELVRLFKNVPLITAPLSPSEIYNVTQATPEAVYAQIEKDLTEAIAETNLPDKVVADTEGGRITKGAAHALLGKVFLYEKKWTNAVQQLADVNGTPGLAGKYGYSLLTNFADIFRPNNKYHTESVLEITHTAIAAINGGPKFEMEGLQASLMFGPRSYSGSIYYAGWGACPITPELHDAIRSDPRFNATVADVDSLVKIGKGKYVPGYMNTGHFVQKFAPLVAYQSTGGGKMQQNYPQDYIEIRLADTYLMEAEALVQAGGDLARAAALLNAVRARVRLNPVAASLDNIYNERRIELATEGHRWYDLVRTGKASVVLASKGFKAGKNEILPIPLQELTNTKLVQNPNY